MNRFHIGAVEYMVYIKLVEPKDSFQMTLTATSVLKYRNTTWIDTNQNRKLEREKEFPKLNS